MSEEQSLKQKTAKGLFWGGLSSSVQQLLGLLFGDRKSTRLNSSHNRESRMPSSA